jgi:hypothetical protein
MHLTVDNLKSFAEIKSLISPFDSICFRGDNIISNSIAFLEKYELSIDTFTHIGMVVTADILPTCIVHDIEYKLNPDKFYILESTMSNNIHDVITDKPKFGVQLRDLEEIIPHHIHNQKTKVAWCKLINNPYDNVDKRPLLQKQFIEFFNDYYPRKYEMDPVGLLSSIITPLRLLRDQRDQIYTKLWKKIHKNAVEKNIPIVNYQFCSELVANVYQLIGIYNDNVITKNVLPVDFFGDKIDHLERVLENPIYIKDWDYKNEKAFVY